LPRGGRLATLEEAGRSKLPKAEHEASEWQAAMEALILVATLGGPAMFARIGVVKALNRHTKRVFNRDRKETIGGAVSWRGTGDRDGNDSADSDLNLAVLLKQEAPNG
jgi:hypothetical protein